MTTPVGHVVSGLGWVLLARLLAQGLALVKLFVLGRLLSPADFGILGVVLFMLGLLDLFTEPGFRVALVQRGGEVGSLLGTVWTTTIIRGLCVAAMLFLGAPHLAWFFNDDRVVAVARTVSMVPILSSMANPTTMLWLKNFKFARMSMLELLTGLTAAVTGIGLAIALGDVWALVWALLAEQIVFVAASFILAPLPPRPSFNPRTFYDLARFGRWVMVGRVLFFALAEGDRAFVGKLLGTTSLGVYGMASRIASFPVTEMGHLVSRLMLPTYAAVQEHAHLLRRAFLTAFYATVSLMIPTFLALIVSAPEIVGGFLGGRWRDAIPVLQILVVGSLFRALDAATAPFYQGTGRPAGVSAFLIVHAVVSGLAIYPAGVSYGVNGVASAVVIGAVVSRCWALADVAAALGLRRSQLLASVSGPLLAGCAMLSISLLSGVFTSVSSTKLVFELLFGISGYLGVLLWLDRRFLATLFRDVRRNFGGLASATDDIRPFGASTPEATALRGIQG